MTEYASNTPVSRPIDTGVKADKDFGGIMWSNKSGFIFAPEDEMLPFRLPTSLLDQNIPPVKPEFRRY